MYRNPRVRVAIIVALLALSPASAFAQNLFDQPNPLAPKAKQAQPASSEAQKRFNRALQLSRENKPDAAIAELQVVKKLLPKQPAVYINLGLCYMQKKNLANAESSFRQALALDPKNSFSRSQLTRVLVGRGKDAEALASAKQMVSANRKDYDGQFLLGVCSLKMKNTAGALSAFKSAFAIRPGDPSVVYNVGYCQATLKKFADARKTFEQFLTIVPNDPQAHLMAGAACEQTGDKADAIAHYEKAAWKRSPMSKSAIMSLARMYDGMKKPDKALDALKKGAAQEKGDYDINISVGRVLSGQRKFKEAEPYLLAAKKTRSDAFVNLNLAMTYASLEKNKEAEACALAALKLDPKSQQSIDVYAWILQKQGKTDAAVAQYRKWEQYYPKDAAPNVKIANIYRDMPGKSELALKDFQKAIAKNPKDSESVISAASCLKELGKPDDAVVLLKKAIAASPKNETAYMVLAGVYDQQKKPELAIEQYRKILEFNDKSNGALRMLASAYDEKKDYEAEIDIYRKLAKADPKDTRAPMSIPRLYDKMGKLDVAIAESKKLVDATPKEMSYRVQYGELLAKNKDYDGAIAQYAELIKSDAAPTKAHGYYLTGCVQETQAKADDAIASYKKSVEAVPSNTLALVAIGKILESRKQQDDFHAYLKSIVEPGKDDLPYGYYRDTLKKAGKSDEALKTIEALAVKYPDSVPIGSVLAEAYTDVGAKDKAVEQYKKLLATDEKLAEKDRKCSWMNRPLGDLYKSMDRNDEAAACYEITLKSMPWDIRLRGDLGDLYARSGKTAKAMEAYQEVLKTQPTNQLVKDKLQALQNGKSIDSVIEAPKPAEAAPQVMPAAPEATKPAEAKPAEQPAAAQPEAKPATAQPEAKPEQK